MLKILDETFDPEKVQWTRPEGGMFLWATLPKFMSTRRMFKYAVDANVAYVTGRAFFPTGGGENCMRLNFTHATDEKIVEGIGRLWEVIQSEMKRQEEKPVLDLEEGITI
jgi:DNA-binding transcriptional MocR family regulator